VDRGGKLGFENLFAVRKKENQDGRQPILTIAGILLLRSLGFFGPEGLNNQNLLVVFRCLVCSVGIWNRLFFFFFFFIAPNRLGFVFLWCVLAVCWLCFVCMLHFTVKPVKVFCVLFMLILCVWPFLTFVRFCGCLSCYRRWDAQSKWWASRGSPQIRGYKMGPAHDFTA